MEVFAGASLGGLVGLLLGLSSSELVGIVVSALTALLGAYFGLKDNSSNTPLQGARLLRVGTFGVSCIVAVLVGLFLRSNNVLGISPEELAESWRKAGFERSDAGQLAAYQRLGLMKGNWRGSEDQKIASIQATSLGILFSDQSPSDCVILENDRHADTNARLKAFQLAGDPWPDIARAAKGREGADLERSLEAAWQKLCNLSAR